MEKNELINDIRISIQDAHSIMKVLEHLACIGDDCSKDDYSGPFRATCPDFESHHSGVWEPLAISLFHGALDMSLHRTWLPGNAASKRFQPYCRGNKPIMCYSCKEPFAA